MPVVRVSTPASSKFALLLGLFNYSW